MRKIIQKKARIFSFVQKAFYKVYTKTGDKGMTSIIGGKRLGKESAIFDVLGDIDELNSHIGLVLYI
jgi:cob(I)alamin adenosyltransferase